MCKDKTRKEKATAMTKVKEDLLAKLQTLVSKSPYEVKEVTRVEEQLKETTTK